MRFLEPCVFYGAHRAETHEVVAHAREFSQHLIALASEARATGANPPAVGADERRTTEDN
jgi:hypothetical protein